MWLLHYFKLSFFKRNKYLLSFKYTLKLFDNTFEILFLCYQPPFAFVTYLFAKQNNSDRSKLTPVCQNTLNITTVSYLFRSWFSYIAPTFQNLITVKIKTATEKFWDVNDKNVKSEFLLKEWIICYVWRASWKLKCTRKSKFALYEHILCIELQINVFEILLIILLCQSV